MRVVHQPRFWSITLFGCLLSLLLISLWAMPMPVQSQFATNTPVPTSDAASFITNTPLPTATSFRPMAPVANYARRLWLEQDMIDLFVSQVEALADGDPDAQKAFMITLHELQKRYPDAPSNPDQRQQILEAMLATPRGTIDMRWIVRPFIQDALNDELIELPVAIYENFFIEVMDANLDGKDATDALVHIRYPADAMPNAVLYEEYVAALRSESGGYLFLETSPDLPAVPFGMIQSVRFSRIDDVNQDTLDEVVLEVSDGSVNDRLYILNNRGRVMADLTQQDNPIRFSAFVSWNLALETIEPAVLQVIQYQEESSTWGCLSELGVDWRYQSNFYRPSIGLNDHPVNQNSLACTLYEAGSIFAMPAEEAIELVEGALQDYGTDVPGAERATMMLSMLYALNGDSNAALSTVQSFDAVESGSWLDSQRMAFLTAFDQPGTTPFDVCQALVAANAEPACDVDAVLGRVFENTPFAPDEDILDQLAAMGLSISRSLSISAVGFADRTAVKFDVVGSGWWAFLQGDETYSAEQIDPPEGTAPVPVVPLTILDVPDSVYHALLVEKDEANTLNIIDNLILDNPNIPLSTELQFIRAFSYDLVGRREPATAGYYEVWESDPLSRWGQLARAHLEQR